MQVPCRVFDHGEGSYTVSYFPTDVGESAVVRPRSRGPILFMAMLCGCTAAVGTAAVQPLLPTVTVPPVRHMAERSRPFADAGDFKIAVTAADQHGTATTISGSPFAVSFYDPNAEASAPPLPKASAAAPQILVGKARFVFHRSGVIFRPFVGTGLALQLGNRSADRQVGSSSLPASYRVTRGTKDRFSGAAEPVPVLPEPQPPAARLRKLSNSVPQARPSPAANTAAARRHTLAKLQR